MTISNMSQTSPEITALICIAITAAPTKHRQQNNLQIKPQRPMLNIVQIMLHASLQTSITSPTVDLRPAGDAGL